MNEGLHADSLLTRALDRLEAARREVAAWEIAVEKLQSLMTPTTSEMTGAAVSSGTQSTGKRGPTAEVVETSRQAEAILLEKGAPIMTGDLLMFLAKRGIDIRGKDPSNTLSARLARSARFETIKGRGWWVKGKPLPDVNSSEAAGHGPTASQTGQPSDGYRATNSPV